LLLGYKPVQPVTVLNTAGNCKTTVLYYNVIIVWEHRRICVRRRLKRRYAAHTCTQSGLSFHCPVVTFVLLLEKMNFGTYYLCNAVGVYAVFLLGWANGVKAEFGDL